MLNDSPQTKPKLNMSPVQRGSDCPSACDGPWQLVGAQLKHTKKQPWGLCPVKPSPDQTSPVVVAAVLTLTRVFPPPHQMSWFMQHHTARSRPWLNVPFKVPQRMQWYTHKHWENPVLTRVLSYSEMWEPLSTLQKKMAKIENVGFCFLSKKWSKRKYLLYQHHHHQQKGTDLVG